MYCQWGSTLSFIKLEVNPTFLDRVADESGFGHADKRRLKQRLLIQDGKLLLLASWMLEELRNGGASGKLYSDSIATMTAVHLLRHYMASVNRNLKSSTSTNKQVSTVIEYMQMNLEKDISLQELAIVANISLSHVVRLFKKQTGMTPHQYLIHLRIERSKQFIRCGNMSMKDVAAQVGFSTRPTSPSYLKE